MRLVSDQVLATLTIWMEARGETHAGRVAVAEVIRNRMRGHIESDGTVAGTVLAPLQFSGWDTHDPNRLKAMMVDTTDPVVVDCQAAWAFALLRSDTVHGATHYFNPDVVTPPWAKEMVLVATIGHHAFYRDPFARVEEA